MTAGVFKLHSRDSAPSADRGRLMSAAEVVSEICHGKRSARWFAQKFGAKIGTKPGRDWFFYEADARQAWNNYLEKGK